MCASSYLHYYRVLADYSHEFDLHWGQIPNGLLLADSTVGRYPGNVRSCMCYNIDKLLDWEPNVAYYEYALPAEYLHFNGG